MEANYHEIAVIYEKASICSAEAKDDMLTVRLFYVMVNLEKICKRMFLCLFLKGIKTQLVVNLFNYNAVGACCTKIAKSVLERKMK